MIRTIGIILPVLLAAVALSACGQAEPPGYAAQMRLQAMRHEQVAEEQPPKPQPPYDVATPAQEASLVPPAAPAPAPRPRSMPKPPSPPQRPATGSAPAAMPPASAGTNGSFVPPPTAQRKSINPENFESLEQKEAEGRAISLNALALAPPSAPTAVKAAISAANEIVGRPYVWGGGHASWYSAGYDCSGAVSYALGGGGFLDTPLTSVGLQSWGAPGPGRWVTVYASDTHAFAVIAGLRWDTVGDARGSGPRWHPALASPQGFVERHPPGY